MVPSLRLWRDQCHSCCFSCHIDTTSNLSQCIQLLSFRSQGVIYHTIIISCHVILFFFHPTKLMDVISHLNTHTQRGATYNLLLWQPYRITNMGVGVVCNAHYGATSATTLCGQGCIIWMVCHIFNKLKCNIFLIW